MDALWNFLFDLIVLLTAAILLGAIAERLRQSAIVGYLLAGALVGPRSFGLIGSAEATEVGHMAELGVALLLFSIGLEFNWSRLRRFGATPWVLGGWQITLTLVLAGVVAWLAGLSAASAAAVGAMVALSSTAVVLRSLAERAELDSVHGRHALGILLLQDIAVVPLVLLVSALAGEASALGVAKALGKEALLAAALVLVLLAFSRYLLPQLVQAGVLIKNRELPILFSIVAAIGSAYAAHRVGLSPALGAFVAGIMIGESPIATQVRADVAALRTLFVTLFFSSIGMLVDPAWISANVMLVLFALVALVLGKALIITVLAMAVRLPIRHAIATGVVLAQAGEFSFVIAQAAMEPSAGESLFSPQLGNLMIAVTVASLLVTPYLINVSLPTGVWIEQRLRRLGLTRTLRPDTADVSPEPHSGHVIIVGFGPAGRAVADAMRLHRNPILIIDLNARTVLDARAEGIAAYVGHAASSEILEHAHADQARAVVVTLPDHRAAVEVIRQTRAMAPDTIVIARARYARYAEELSDAGAHVVIDEENTVGQHLGDAVTKAL